MKIIEAMKQIKDLQLKIADIKKKVAAHCADMDFETPTYGADQKKQIDEWLQSIHDMIVTILERRIAIQRTNLATPVTIEIGGKQVTKSIAEWIHRRRDLAENEREAWAGLTDKGLRESRVKTTAGDDKVVTIRRYFDPKTRDEKIELYRSEPSKIDATLEVINAITDII